MTRRALYVALMVVLGAAGAIPAGAAARDPLTDNLAARLLDAHNRERDAVGVPRLVWSESLAAHARAWAAHLAKAGQLAHSPDDVAEASSEGENLWAGTSGAYSLEQMMGLWTEERARFRPGPFREENASGGADDIGHYSQIIWRSTREVGCAVADNGADEYLVCRYAEPGNVTGERPF